MKMVEIWTIPLNTKYFDIVKNFQSSDKVIIKKSRPYKKGDLAYIYLALPYGELRYICEVVNDNLSKEFVSEHAPYALINSLAIKNYIEIRLLSEMHDEKLKYPFLKEHGLGQVQLPARMSRELKRYLKMNNFLIEKS